MAFTPSPHLADLMLAETDYNTDGLLAVVVETGSVDHYLQVIPMYGDLLPFDVIFEGNLGSAINWNAFLIFDSVMMAGHGQQTLLRVSPHGDMLRYIVPSLTMDRFLFVIDWLSTVRAAWHLQWISPAD